MTLFNSKWRGGLRPLPGLLAVTLGLAACNTDDLVHVTDPARLPPSALDNPGAVPSLITGAVRQFFVGYSGAGGDSYMSTSGVFTDELYYGDTFTTRRALDIRTQQSPALGNQEDGSFVALQQARFNARRAYAAIDKYFPTDGTNKALMRAVEGYTYVTLGEGWCGYVPFSVVPDTGAIDPQNIEHGTPLTTAQMFNEAIARFDQALALDPSNRLAKLGKARALLDNGNYAAAAAAVAGIPSDWTFMIEHSANTGSENNGIYGLQSNGRYGVSNDEGGPITPASERPSGSNPSDNGEGLNYRSINDPRVPFTGDPKRIAGPSAGPNTCFSSSVPCWYDNNNPNNDADVPLASGVEARLIEAEALLNAGDVAGWLAKLNDLRANVAPLLAALRPNQVQVFPLKPGAVAPLPALADPGTFQSRLLLTMQERNLWMFLTGHRLGDLRRLVRNYGFAQDQVFPSGAFWRSGGTYGTDVAFLVPFNEQNNPSFDPNQCRADQA